MANDRDRLPAKSGSAEVAEFLDKLARTPTVRPAGGRGRLIFAMDATASREPTWDRACHIQSQMFEETATLGGLEVQLVFYRGFGECRASPWVASSHDLVAKMTAVRCLGGQTQIARVLKHALAETKRSKVDALVFVGDCMEENVDELCHLTGQLGVLSVPCFMFHEGNDPIAHAAFSQIAKLSGGACCSFDAASAHLLRDLLSAVAVFAAGGRRALEDYGKRAGAEVRLIANQMKK